MSPLALITTLALVLAVASGSMIPDYPPFPHPLTPESTMPLQRGGSPAMAAEPGSLLSSPAVAYADTYGSALALSKSSGILAVHGLAYDTTLGSPSTVNLTGRVDIYRAAAPSSGQTWRFVSSVLSPFPSLPLDFGRAIALSNSGNVLVAGSNRKFTGSPFPHGVLFVYDAVYTPELDYSLTAVIPCPNISSIASQYIIGSAGSVVISPDTLIIAASDAKATVYTPTGDMVAGGAGLVVIFWRTATSVPFSPDNFHVITPFDIEPLLFHGDLFDPPPSVPSSIATDLGDYFGHSLTFNSGVATSYYFDDAAGTTPRVPTAIYPKPPDRTPAMQATFDTAQTTGAGYTTFLAITSPAADSAANEAIATSLITNEGKTYVFSLVHDPALNLTPANRTYFNHVATLVRPGAMPQLIELCGSSLSASDDALFVGCRSEPGFRKLGSVLVWRPTGLSPRTPEGFAAVLTADQDLSSWYFDEQIFEPPPTFTPPIPQSVRTSFFGSATAWLDAYNILAVASSPYPSGGKQGKVSLLRRNSTGAWTTLALMYRPSADGEEALGSTLAAAGASVVAGGLGIFDFSGAVMTSTCATGFGGVWCASAFCPAGCVNGDCSSPGVCTCSSPAWTGPRCDLSVSFANATAAPSLIAVTRTSLTLVLPTPPAAASVPIYIAVSVDGLDAVIVNTATLPSPPTVTLTALTPGAGIVISVRPSAIPSAPLAASTTATTPLTLFTLCPLGSVEAPGSNEHARICSPCLASTYAALDHDACTPCPPATTSPISSANISACTCLPFFYTPIPFTPGIACSPCPSGASCSSGGITPPAALPGFYPTSYSTFVRCVPAGSCLGATSNTSSACAPAYAGYLCRDCAASFYYDGHECTRCPAAAAGVAVGYVAAVLLIGLGVFVVAVVGLQSGSDASESATSALGNFAFVHFSLALTTLQVAALMLSWSLEWPTGASSLAVGLASVVVISSDSLAFECLVASFATRYIITLLVPFAVMGVIAAAYYLARAVAPTSLPSSGVLLRSLVILTPPIAIPALRSSFALYDCTQLPNGTWVLDSARGVACFDSAWWALFPVGLLAIIIFVATAGALFINLFRARADLDSPTTAAIYGSLYARYHSRWYMWELVQLLRRVGVVVLDLFFSSYPFAQLGLAFTLFAGLLGISLRLGPYRTQQHNAYSWVAETLLIALLLVGALYFSEKSPSALSSAVLGVAFWLVLSGIFFLAIVGVAVELYQLVTLWRAGKLDTRPSYMDDSALVFIGARKPNDDDIPLHDFNDDPDANVL